jgi:hypothetical protein
VGEKLMGQLRIVTAREGLMRPKSSSRQTRRQVRLTEEGRNKGKGIDTIAVANN